GQDVTRQTPRQMIARGVTYVPQGRNVVPQLSVYHNLELGGITAPDQGKVKARIEQVMDQFPMLREFKDRKAVELSGGQQKQLEVARALLLDPKLILIDEPSIGLSPNLVQEVFRTLTRLRDQGVLFIGSGNIVHALGRARWEPEAPAWDWAEQFDADTAAALTDRRLDQLLDPYGTWREARIAVPTDEHYRPMVAALSLLHPEEEVRFFNASIDMGSIGMRSFVTV
uniref:ATP-binding cassette domain-containing protein n=1 Tax=uncultured Aeromicrobium sp. TaxID=337820 RepID=UPI0025916B07